MVHVVMNMILMVIVVLDLCVDDVDGNDWFCSDVELSSIVEEEIEFEWVVAVVVAGL